MAWATTQRTGLLASPLNRGEELDHAVRVVLLAEDAQPMQHVDQAAGISRPRLESPKVFDLHPLGNRHRVDVFARLL